MNLRNCFIAMYIYFDKNFFFYFLSEGFIQTDESMGRSRSNSKHINRTTCTSHQVYSYVLGIAHGESKEKLETRFSMDIFPNHHINT